MDPGGFFFGDYHGDTEAQSFQLFPLRVSVPLWLSYRTCLPGPDVLSLLDLFTASTGRDKIFDLRVQK